MEELVVKPKRRPKTPDKDLKDYFSDYKTAQERIHKIKKHLISRPLTENELDEIKDLESIMEANAEILDCFTEPESIILKGYYLEGRKQRQMAPELFYGEEYVSYLKVNADVRLREIISGDIIHSYIGLNLMAQVKDYLATNK